MLQKIFKLLGKIFYPSRCPLCGKIVEKDFEICQSCKPTVEEITAPICKRCGSKKADCTCSERRNLFQSVVAPFYYFGSVERGIKRFKYKSYPENVNFFTHKTAELVKREFSGYKIGVITFVPMTKKKLRKRGFNPSEVLATKISEELEIPCADVMVKLYENKTQHYLREDERAGNVLGVFDVAKTELIKGKTVLLCDDIITTGATLDECVKMLYLRGANTVICACVAKTLPPKIRKKKQRK